jgi:hypothetical protein
MLLQALIVPAIMQAIIYNALHTNGEYSAMLIVNSCAMLYIHTTQLQRASNKAHHSTEMSDVDLPFAVSTVQLD